MGSRGLWRVDTGALHAGAVLRIVARSGLVIAVWTDAPTLEELTELERAGRHQLRENKNRAALLNVIVSGTPNFDEKVRERVNTITRKAEPFNWVVGHLILISGLAGAATRAFVSAGALIARASIPTKVFSDKIACAGWLASALGPPWTEARVTLIEEGLLISACR